MAPPSTQNFAVRKKWLAGTPMAAVDLPVAALTAAGLGPALRFHDSAIRSARRAAVRATRITPFGVMHEVVVMIDGLNGATVAAVTTWIIDGGRAAAPDINLGGHPMNRCDDQRPMHEPRHEILEVVELLADSGRWPAGTVGTVVEADDDKALVELSDDRGHGLDFISVPQRALGSRSPRSEDRVAS